MANQHGNYYGTTGGQDFHNLRATGHGRQFLNQMLDACLAGSIIQGQNVADLGCGSGVVTHQLAERGAGTVFANDIQPTMVEAALRTISTLPAEIRYRVSITGGDVARLDCDGSVFDIIASINVGCNLDLITLDAHFREMKRTLRRHGKVVFALPDNLYRIFTTGELTEADAVARLQEVITGVNATNIAEIRAALIKVPEVLYATFVVRNDSLRLVAQSDIQLNSGEEIWRIVPGPLGIPNVFHRCEDYVRIANKHGLVLRNRMQNLFPSESSRRDYNQTYPGLSLGQTYSELPCFTVLEFIHADND